MNHVCHAIRWQHVLASTWRQDNEPWVPCHKLTAYQHIYMVTSNWTMCAMQQADRILAYLHENKTICETKYAMTDSILAHLHGNKTKTMNHACHAITRQDTSISWWKQDTMNHVCDALSWKHTSIVIIIIISTQTQVSKCLTVRHHLWITICEWYLTCQ